MELEKKIASLSLLGKYLRCFIKNYPNIEVSSNYNKEILATIKSSYEHNKWFTPENVLYAIQSWGELLTQNHLQNWLQPYNITNKNSAKKVLVVMAGNIPLVGFHDFISVLLTGHKAMVKLSSKDKLLLPLIGKILLEIDPAFSNLIIFSKERTNFDAVIATGSNNTARYFAYYFSKKPHIIRKNRHSVAILNGTESQETLEKLGTDIFRYFGLGCRNISKIYVPRNYNFEPFFEAISPYKKIMESQKYSNNYHYNKTVYLMDKLPFLDNGFLILRENKGNASPIATLFYEYYSKEKKLISQLNSQKEQIQCVVGNLENYTGVAFGKTQQPALTDYADGIDTVQFLSQL